MNWQANTCSIPVDILNAVAVKTVVGIQTIQHISTGCYADIYLLTLQNTTSCILKLFRFPGIAEQELRSYDIIKSNHALPMPELLFADPARNYICMEYIQGLPLSRVSTPNDALASEVADLLIHCHKCHRAASTAEATHHWQTVYSSRQKDILKRSKLLAENGQLEEDTYRIFEFSTSALLQVLGNSVQRLSLIHGDFTPWNIMVDCKSEYVTAVLDPYLAGYGDSEYDLMMMNKANGIPLNLVASYLQKIPPSTQFERKAVYYNAWNELCHYFYSNRKQTMNISERAYELKQVI